MAFEQSGYKGTIDGKDTRSFINKLDFELTQVKRVKLVDDITYNDGCLDGYYQKYFDEKFDCNLTKDKTLSDKNNVCKSLESMANYILFADDTQKVRKTEYNFYTVTQLKNRFGRELSLDKLIEMSYKTIYENSNDDSKMTFILEKGRNYKKSIEQRISKKDIESIKAISDYQYLKDVIGERLKDLRRLNSNKLLQRTYVLMMKELKTEQIICKDAILGVIYFKNPMQDSCKPDYEEFDFLDYKHVQGLMCCKNTNITSDIGCLVTDYNAMLKSLKLTSDEKTIIEMYRKKDMTHEEISVKIKCSRQYVTKVINKISDKMIKEYYKVYEDWYYLNICKGKYKKCSKCKEIKLKSKYGKYNKTKDKLHPYCKECR